MSGWLILQLVWILGIPGAYAATVPSDGEGIRWFIALFWPPLIIIALLWLSGEQLWNWTRGRTP